MPSLAEGTLARPVGVSGGKVSERLRVIGDESSLRSFEGLAADADGAKPLRAGRCSFRRDVRSRSTVPPGSEREWSSGRRCEDRRRWVRGCWRGVPDFLGCVWAGR